MKVVVDTSVWSALRRNQILEDLPQVLSLRELIADGRVALLGAIRQEVLSGIREIEQFVRLRDYLRCMTTYRIDNKLTPRYKGRALKYPRSEWQKQD